MLRSLDIRDMLIIDRLELTLSPGLNVLTGETGAGKSILLDALGFVLGWRGRAELVREGAEQGEVVAEFDLAPGHPAFAVLAEAGLPQDDVLILRRVNAQDGRKTAWANDRRVSGEVLRQLSDTLVELHGQHDDRGLLNPRGHRQMLDAFGGLEDLVARTRVAWRDLQGARAALEEAEARLAAVREEEDFLRHAVAEMDKVAPEPGEEETLDASRRLMQAAGRIREDVARAHEALGSSGAEGLLRDAARWLEDAAGQAEGTLDVALAALDRALVELGDAEDGVARALDRLDVDPGELERVEERLFAIRALSRKHGVQPDDLPGLADDFRTKLAELDAGAGDLKSLRRGVGEAEAAYEDAADALGQARAEAAGELDTAMAAELAPLKMERATFATEISEGDAGPEGRDHVAFTVATNPGAPAGPLNRIASGGEMSRFLLALKVCLTSDAEGLTMIFDEIDRGVGGATADAVGRRLEALAEDSQVLVVTHSPQVAARAGHHWRVEKSVEGGMTLSRVTSLSEGERVDEIARMLAGDTVTDEARAAARALLSA
ncbi:DNA repair protein RecN [Silicimonas algicola]|uniref:DNA repair protein RecN n=1 Tax=Silicimonas algicola TaxID=1826607 RepID=A0A316G7I7_9RHOB|nr:DNA repair protein RecN [Silicimonas algicola]AZQ67246.1 DNA repair protein RecN [Silicimonas algicola]PWK56911.1 DNA replication and repair protein RecN [Silicimonas algicola]